jgi:hypothetical protein
MGPYAPLTLVDAGEGARIALDSQTLSEERMEPKKLYGAAAARKTNASTEDAMTIRLREEVWQGLGLSPEELGARLRLALDTAVMHLEATEVKYFSHEGVITDERTVAYHNAQLKAVQTLRRLMKMLARAEGNRPMTIEVNVINV